MKNNLIILTILAMLTIACQTEQPLDTEQHTTIKPLEIPDLLDRHVDLRHGTEWDQIQRLYVAQQQALHKDQANGESWLTLAQIFINEARITGEHGHYYPAALAVVDKGLAGVERSDDLRFRLLSTKASVELSQHDFEQALKTAQEAVQLNPYNAQIYGALVDAHVELGEYEKAVEMADKMVSIRPDLRSYSRVSYLREIHGDIPGAIEAMELAIAAGFPGQETSCWARLTLGELYETYGEQSLAKQQYEMALAERPDYPFAMAKLAVLQQEAGELEGAEQQLMKAAEIIPEFGFYVDLAALYRLQGRSEKAEETLAEVLLMLEDDVKNGHQMDMEYAFLYLDMFDDPQEALVYAKKEYDRRPENIDVNLLMAKIYERLGDEAATERHVQKAGRTHSIHPDLIALAQ